MLLSYCFPISLTHTPEIPKFLGCPPDGGGRRSITAGHHLIQRGAETDSGRRQALHSSTPGDGLAVGALVVCLHELMDDSLRSMADFTAFDFMLCSRDTGVEGSFYVSDRWPDVMVYR